MYTIYTRAGPIGDEHGCNAARNIGTRAVSSGFFESVMNDRDGNEERCSWSTGERNPSIVLTRAGGFVQGVAKSSGQKEAIETST